MSADQAKHPEIRIELRSNPLYLSGAREMVAAVARRLGFTDEACGQIALAVDEALCNVIRHGYDRASDKPIWISLWPVGSLAACEGPACPITPEANIEALRIVIDDEARQVDPSVIKSRNLEDVRPGGLGVHIIKAVMDEVSYEKRPTIGMRLTMTKVRVAHPTSDSKPVSAPGAETVQNRQETTDIKSASASPTSHLPLSPHPPTTHNASASVLRVDGVRADGRENAPNGGGRG
ncbi:MAG: ATP-binding protein [Pyrinomonadaceae bacterium]|nr:ATP-binding protein [Phycisphaerales bacterium]